MLKKNTHEKMKAKLLKDPEFKAEYLALEDEFTLLEELIRARKKSDKTQAEVAKLMGTTTSVVGRLESCAGQAKHSPTIATLRRYAKALGCKLVIKLVPEE